MDQAVQSNEALQTGEASEKKTRTRKAAKSAWKITLFVVLLIAALLAFHSVFAFKYGDGIYSLEKFYALEPNTVDVLILGSSHAFESFNTGTLWDEYGYASYMLGGATQPLWNTYYYMKEALRTQTPKVIILEAYCVTLWSEYMDEANAIKNTAGLRWSMDKVEAIKASVPSERVLDHLLPWRLYHNRYRDLTREDYLPDQGNPLYADWKGFANNMRTTPWKDVPDMTGVTETTDIYPKNEEYYRKILALAQEKEIPVLVVVAPYTGIFEHYQKMFNRAREIAGEYDALFINSNLMLDEIGMDWSEDCADESHLNYRGSRKFTSNIGMYLGFYYDLPDRRGDPRYASWDRMAAYIRRMNADQEIINCGQPLELFDMLSDPQLELIVSVEGSCNPKSASVRPLLHKIGLTDVQGPGLWVVKNGAPAWQATPENPSTSIETPSHDLFLECSFENNTVSTRVIADRNSLTKVQNGLNVQVYDPVTDEIVSSFALDTDQKYRLVR